MVLSRNVNFHTEYYPGEAEPEDKEKGLLDDAGRKLPLIDHAVYSLEKEAISSWNKFLQGYFDNSSISTDSFDKAIQVTPGGAEISKELREKGVQLLTTVMPTTFYLGFNMLDETIGTLSEKKRKLRQAISIAVDIEEMIQIYQNDRGVAAQGPIPPGIFGFAEGREGMNPYIYDWDEAKHRPVRKSIEEARRLLAEAGYRNGIDQETGRKLQLYLDTPQGSPIVRSRNEWMSKQLAKIDIDLQIRETDYNQFLEKLLKGNTQLFWSGWHADYPDPENFLFLLYGPNGKALHKGENGANYSSSEFDFLFTRVENMANGPERRELIRKIYQVIQRDSPWIWGFHAKAYLLYHDWYHNSKPMHFVSNSLKYKRIDSRKRKRKIEEWNEPVTWPVYMVLLLFIAIIAPLVVKYLKTDRGVSTMKELWESFR